MTAQRHRQRAIGARGERYPEWLRALEGASGAYIIRDASTRDALYVGESHTGRLYQTITRHVQAWARLKTHWVGMLGAQQHDPGTTYARDAVTVEVITSPPGEAVRLQGRLIARLKPRDNLIGADAPF